MITNSIFNSIDSVPCYGFIQPVGNDAILAMAYNYACLQLTLGVDGDRLDDELREWTRDHGLTIMPKENMQDGSRSCRHNLECLKKVVLLTRSKHTACWHYYESYDKTRKACKLCKLSKHFCNGNRNLEDAIIRCFITDPISAEWILTARIKDDMFHGVQQCGEDNAIMYEMAKSLWIFFSKPENYMVDVHGELEGRLRLRIREDMQRLGCVRNGYSFEKMMAELSRKEVVEWDDRDIFDLINLFKTKASEFAKKQSGMDEGIVYAIPIEIREQLKSKTVIENAYVQNLSHKQMIREEENRPERGAGQVIEEVGKNPERQKKRIIEKIITSPNHVNIHDEKPRSSRYTDIWEYRPFEGSMVMMPRITKEELTRYSVDLDEDLEALEQFKLRLRKPNTAGNRKWMPVECAVVEGKEVYVLFDSFGSEYYHTRLENNACLTAFREIFSMETCKFICYMPYCLVSNLRKKRIYVKNLYSIFLLSAVEHPGHTDPMKRVLEMMGARNWDGLNCGRKSDCSTIIRFEHCYEEICRGSISRIAKMNPMRKKEAVDMMEYGMALSFFYDKEKGQPFILRTAGKYRFRSKITQDNDSITCRINVLDEDCSQTKKIEEIICGLHQTEALITTQYQIRGIGNHQFMLTMSSDEKQGVLRAVALYLMKSKKEGVIKDCRATIITQHCERAAPNTS